MWDNNILMHNWENTRSMSKQGAYYWAYVKTGPFSDPPFIVRITDVSAQDNDGIIYDIDNLLIVSSRLPPPDAPPVESGKYYWAHPTDDDTVQPFVILTHTEGNGRMYARALTALPGYQTSYPISEFKILSVLLSTHQGEPQHLPRVGRVEVIQSDTGRAYTSPQHGKNKVYLSFQDDGRTLKIFLNGVLRTHTADEPWKD
jgi:hypothetical protein